MKTAIFILGMHRSGTSALAGALDLMGLEFGSDLMAANAGNPKGYFENNFVYKLNEKILKESNSSWDDYRFELNKVDSSKKQEYIKEAKEIIDQEFRYAKNFVIKDPRNCLLFPLWQEACRELEIDIKVVLPYRNPVEVAASLKKRNNFSYEKSLILWAKHFLSAEYLSRGVQRVFTTFDELINHTDETLKMLEAFTALPVPSTAKEHIAKEFLDSSVKHNNISLANFTQDIPSFLQKILQLIQTKDFDENALDEIRKDFLFSLDFFQHEETFRPQIELEKTKQENEMLKKLADITKLDPDYYLEKNGDIRRSGIDPYEHYYLQGKKEGRLPNYYCEYHNIKTVDKVSNDEERYLQSDEIQKLKSHTNHLDNEMHKLQEHKQTMQQEYEQKVAQMSKQVQSKQEELETLNAHHEKLKEQNTQKQEQLEQKTKELEALNADHSNLSQNLDEVVEDLASIKEHKQTMQQEYEQKVAQMSKQVQSKQEELETLNAHHEKLKEQNTQKQEQLEQKTKELEALNTQHSTLKTQHEQKEQEAANLNKEIDKVVEDLASIKESKCWIYTKPIRNLQKAIKNG